MIKPILSRGFKRNVVLVSSFALPLLMGCKPPSVTEAESLAVTVKATVDPVQLQQWAVSNIQHYRSGDEISSNALPAAIRRLYSGGPPTALVLQPNDKGQRSIMVTWGDGFGHRGLTVGDSNYVEPETRSAYVTRWIPGVFIWAERH